MEPGSSRACNDEPHINFQKIIEKGLGCVIHYDISLFQRYLKCSLTRSFTLLVISKAICDIKISVKMLFQIILILLLVI